MNTNQTLNSDIRRNRPRRGVSLVVVIMLVSIAMAVSFAVVHSQGTALRVQQNSQLRANARQAAQAGMAVALREACNPDWTGVDTSISGNISPCESFTATYDTGDDTLVEGGDGFEEYPYRVTIKVTGYACDPSHPERESRHVIRAVIRLVPYINPDTEPNGWDEIQNNTFCQWKDEESKISFPVRIEGPMRIRGKLTLFEDGMHWHEAGWWYMSHLDDVRWWYMKHLRWMQEQGLPDYRPFNGPVEIAEWKQDTDTLDILEDALEISTSNRSSTSVYTWTVPAIAEGYRLYPGGKIYYPEFIGGDISGENFLPNYKTNPLGIFICTGTVRFRGNVSLEGSIIGGDDVEIYGDTNNFSPLKVPPYIASDGNGAAKVQLPTIFSDDDVKFKEGASAAVKGLIMAKDKLQIEQDGQDVMNVEVQGKVMAMKLEIKPRDEWLKSKDWWEDASDYYPYWYPLWGDVSFPVWLQDVAGLNLQSRISIKPDGEAARYHWYKGDNPLFQQKKDANGDDTGLRWQLISWTDNP